MITLNLREVVEFSTKTDATELDVTSRTEPDPTWRDVDQAGHVHHWEEDGSLPSLIHIVDEWGADEDGEEYVSRSHYECKFCGERISPRWRAGTAKKVRGITRLSLSATLLDSSQYEAAARALKANEKVHLLLPQDFEGDAYLKAVILLDPPGFRVLTIRAELSGKPVFKK